MMIVMLAVMITRSIMMTCAMVMFWSAAMIILSVMLYLYGFKNIDHNRTTSTGLTNVFSNIKTDGLYRNNCA